MDDKSKVNEEITIRTHGWWAFTRPYRALAMLMSYTAICLCPLVIVLSKTADIGGYKVFGIVNPIYIVGLLSGGLGGCVRGLIDFRRKDSHDFRRSDYWKHLLPVSIGCVFGFVMILTLHSTLKVISIPHNINDPGGLSFLSMICFLSGLFADKAEMKLLKTFKNI